jgi:hypothetical protein
MLTHAFQVLAYLGIHKGLSFLIMSAQPLLLNYGLGI